MALRDLEIRWMDIVGSFDLAQMENFIISYCPDMLRVPRFHEYRGYTGAEWCEVFSDPTEWDLLFEGVTPDGGSFRPIMIKFRAQL